MSSVGSRVQGDRRRHGRDAGATRRALLEAAADLFQQRGYDGATVRAIGARANADPALIARYFGSKEGLYIAALAAADDDGAARVPDPAPSAVARRLLDRWGGPTSSPVARALVTPGLSDDVRALLRRVLDGRLIGPIAEVLEERGHDRARLRAETLVAMLLGLAVARSTGHLPELARASTDDLVEILGRALEP
ncbi:MAG: TetR family transcriptional regulator [Thermoleophilaceae bacterium]